MWHDQVYVLKRSLWQWKTDWIEATGRRESNQETTEIQVRGWPAKVVAVQVMRSGGFWIYFSGISVYCMWVVRKGNQGSLATATGWREDPLTEIGKSGREAGLVEERAGNQSSLWLWWV